MIDLIGGEMAAFTEDRPAAGGALLTDLVGRLPAGASVLVAGPHTGELIDALAARTDVTCLVRSQPEAIALDARGRRVRCGSLARLPATGQYDIVVALDGLDRLCSVEGPQYDWSESLEALTRVLRPGGTLLLAVENDLGVHRLVDPATPTSAQTDSAWLALGEFDTRPGTPTTLAERLAGQGLAVDWLGAAWPLPAAPTLIATPNALRDGPIDALAAAAAGAVGRAYADSSVLSDPRRLAATAVRAGLGAELAAAWIVVAHRAPRPAATLRLPPVLLPGGELTTDPDGRWLRPDGVPLPVGRLLEELLLGACLRHDLSMVRRLLTGWMAAQPTATADNVVLHHDTYAVLDPTAGPQPDVLRRFARTLLDGGYAHPWPAATDPGTLTAILHGAAGLPETVPAPPTGDEPPPPDQRREHEEQLRALRRQMADAASRAEWYERELAKRERELRKARIQIAAFSGTVGFRVAKLGFGVARKARNRIRKGQS
jgi:SAM-dependent methyltransferase